MKLFIVPILVIAYLKSCNTVAYQDYYDVYSKISENTPEVPPPESRLLNLFKGWKGDDGHPLTEFGKIHIINRGGGWGWGGGHGKGHGHGHGHGNGWGAGWGQYGPGYTTYQHTTGWKAPSKKKSWLKFPKKSFGIHVKGGVGFSFGGDKKGEHKAVVVHQSSPGWGWNSGQGNNYGWGQGGGWGHGGGQHGGSLQDYDSGDYYDDNNENNKEQQQNDEESESDRRRMDMVPTDYLYEY